MCDHPQEIEKIESELESYKREISELRTKSESDNLLLQERLDQQEHLAQLT